MVDGLSLGPLFMPYPRLFLLLSVAGMLGVGYVLERLTGRQLSNALWLVLLGGVVIGRLGYVVQQWDFYRDHPLQALYLWQDGYTIGFAIGGGVLTALILALLRRPRSWLLAPPVAAGIALWFGLTMAVPQAGHDGPGMPPLVLDNTDGERIPLQGFQGEPLVLNLWATWCPPCRREMPAFQAASADWDDVQFVFGNQGESADDVHAYLDDEDLRLEHVLLDTGSELSSHFGAHGMPVTLFFAADGSLHDVHVGEVSAARLHQYLRDLTNEQ